MDKNLLKLRQNKDAHTIKDLLIRLSNEHRLPETYHPDDFKIVDDYIEHQDEYAEVKIEIKNRYCISPTIIRKPGMSLKKGKKHLLETKGWLVEEIVQLASTYDEPPQTDAKDIGKFSGTHAVVRMILVNDVAELVDSALCFIAESEDAEAIEEAWKNVIA